MLVGIPAVETGWSARQSTDLYFGRPEYPAAFRSASGSSSFPSSMTTRVCRRSAMRVDGSPSTRTRSAVLPTFTEPVVASWRTSLAGTIVAAAIYLLILLPLVRLVGVLERQFARNRHAA